MKLSTSNLIKELQEQTRSFIDYADHLQQLPLEQLTQRKNPASWNALECLEHLNRYGNFYLPEIENRIIQSNTKSALTFTPGLLGNYFANSMKPSPTTKKIKTFKSMNPLNSNLDKSVISEFIRQQQQMLELLERSQKIDLNKTKTSISISKLIKLKLGDTFRFVIYHNQRHIEQTKRSLLPESVPGQVRKIA